MQHDSGPQGRVISTEGGYHDDLCALGDELSKRFWKC